MFTLVTSAVTRSAVRRTLSSMAAAPASLTTNDLWSATGEPLLTMSQSQQHVQDMMPRTFREALLDQEHAVVVTTASAPHRIVHVNAAWERLCGFSKREALHQTLNILQGPDTNVNLADSIVQAVVKEHHSSSSRDMYLINYRKNGSPFKNHVTIAPCPLELNNGQSVELLVAVLEEVDTVPLRMAY